VAPGLYPSSSVLDNNNILYPLYLLFFVLGGATSQIGQNDRYQLGLQLTPPRKDIRHNRKGPRPPEAAPATVLTPLQRTTDQGWTEPPGTPDGNVTWFRCLGLTQLA